MATAGTFERYELKFVFTPEQYVAFKNAAAKYLRPDKYGESDICNLYCDTPDFLLVRRSNEKPFYKEKLRIRSYGMANENSDVFLEIKKKYDSVVYKRRIVTNEQSAFEILSGKNIANDQISKEIAYFTKLYEGIKPQMFISYRREAFYGVDNDDLRITFDRSILWRDYDLSLKNGIYGRPVTPPDKILAEIKTAASIPLWLTGFLSENKIYKTSFSKYGAAYISMQSEKIKGGLKSA